MVPIAALVVALLASWAFAGSADAVVVQLPNGRLVGVTPRAGVAPASFPGVRGSRVQPHGVDNGTVDYHGGPVVHSSMPYLIFWGPLNSFPSSTVALMTRYFTDVAHDSGLSTNVYGVMRQYTDATGFADYQQTFSPGAQAVFDTDAYPARDGTNCPDVNASYYPTCLTDAQLQSELTNLIGASGLPTDGSTGHSELVANAPIYFIVTPPDVNVCDPSIGCSDTTFCAYHSYYTDGGSRVLYAAIDLLSAESADPALSPKECQSDGNSAVQEPNGNGGDVAIKYISHEDSEAITDPLINAWWDSASHNEIGDNCNQYGPTNPASQIDPNAFEPVLGGSASPVAPATTGTLFDQLINGDKYYIQSEWSNGAANCEMQPSDATLSPTFTTPSGTPAVGRPVSFNPSTGAPPGGYSSVTWDFGDDTSGFTTGNASASHIYAAPGTYTVTLTAVDLFGNVATASQTITVYTAPVAVWTTPTANPLVGSTVSFDGTGSSDSNFGGQVSSYDWSFGDGTTATGATATHTYTSAGIYTVQLTVADSLGLVSTTSRQIEVVAPPTAGFTVPSAPPLAGHAVTFDGGRSADPNSGGQVATYDWSFGDGTTATGTGSSTSHTYASPGIYTVQLTVADNFGVLSSPVSEQVQVLAPPTASFTFSPAAPVAGHAVTFSGTAADPNGGGQVSSYDWSFGDGTTGTGATASHTFTTPGTYTVQLTVTDSFGLGKSAGGTVVVAAPGKPSASQAHLSLAPGKPKLTFVLTAGANAASLGRFVVALPTGLSFVGKRLAKGVSVITPGRTKLHFREKLIGGKLAVTLNRGADAFEVAIAGGAITNPRIHGHRLSGASVKSVRIAITVVDLSGRQTPLVVRPS